MSGDPYSVAARAMIDLAASLVAAREVRYLPPVRTVVEREDVSGTREITNPTLDTVLDGRRWAVSTRVTETEQFLRQLTYHATRHRAHLEAALAAWNNEEQEDGA